MLAAIKDPPVSDAMHSLVIGQFILMISYFILSKEKKPIQQLQLCFKLKKLCFHTSCVAHGKSHGHV